MDIHQDILCKVVRVAGKARRTVFKATFGECDCYVQHRAAKERKAGNNAVIDGCTACGSLTVKSRKGKLLYRLRIADVE